MFFMDNLMSMLAAGSGYYWDPTFIDLKIKQQVIARYCEHQELVPPFSFGYDDCIAEDTAQNIYTRIVMGNIALSIRGDD